MEPDQGDKGPERVEDAVFALRKEVLPHLVSPIGTIVPGITPIRLISESVVVASLAVAEGDVHLAAAEAGGGACRKVIFKQS